MKDNYDIEDIEAFIKGLKETFDNLDETVNVTQGFQLHLARAISELRSKKIAKIEPAPKFSKDGKLLTQISKEDLKNFLLNELEFLTSSLDSGNIQKRKKFELVMKIAQIREKIKNL